MTISKTLAAVLLSLAALVPATGCTASATTDPEPVVVDPGPTTTSTGTLIVDWTISGTKDPAQCQQGNAANIDIVVTGPKSGEFQQTCGTFATSIELPAGHYTANAVLLDPSSNERTTVVDMGPFDILGSDQLTIPIDFPANSFRLVSGERRPGPSIASLLSAMAVVMMSPVSLLRHLLATLSLALTLLGAARSARAADVAPRLVLRRPLSLRMPALVYQPTFVLAPGSVSWDLPLPAPAMPVRRSGDYRARPPSEEVLFAPLRDPWVAGALRRNEGSVSEGDKKPVGDQLMSQMMQVGAVGLLASAFIPNGQVYSTYSETLRGTVHFTPTTFSGTGAGIRLWGDFW